MIPNLSNSSYIVDSYGMVVKKNKPPPSPRTKNSIPIKKTKLKSKVISKNKSKDQKNVKQVNHKKQKKVDNIKVIHNSKQKFNNSKQKKEDKKKEKTAKKENKKKSKNITVTLKNTNISTIPDIERKGMTLIKPSGVNNVGNFLYFVPIYSLYKTNANDWYYPRVIPPQRRVSQSWDTQSISLYNHHHPLYSIPIGDRIPDDLHNLLTTCHSIEPFYVNIQSKLNTPYFIPKYSVTHNQEVRRIFSHSLPAYQLHSYPILNSIDNINVVDLSNDINENVIDLVEDCSDDLNEQKKRKKKEEEEEEMRRKKEEEEKKEKRRKKEEKRKKEDEEKRKKEEEEEEKRKEDIKKRQEKRRKLLEMERNDEDTKQEERRKDHKDHKDHKEQKEEERRRRKEEDYEYSLHRSEAIVKKIRKDKKQEDESSSQSEDRFEETISKEDKLIRRELRKISHMWRKIERKIKHIPLEEGELSIETRKKLFFKKWGIVLNDLTPAQSQYLEELDKRHNDKYNILHGLASPSREFLSSLKEDMMKIIKKKNDQEGSTPIKPTEKETTPRELEDENLISPKSDGGKEGSETPIETDNTNIILDPWQIAEQHKSNFEMLQKRRQVVKPYQASPSEIHHTFFPPTVYLKYTLIAKFPTTNALDTTLLPAFPRISQKQVRTPDISQNGAISIDGYIHWVEKKHKMNTKKEKERSLPLELRRKLEKVRYEELQSKIRIQRTNDDVTKLQLQIKQMEQQLQADMIRHEKLVSNLHKRIEENNKKIGL